MPTPTRAPQTDAVQRAREVEDVLRETELSTYRNVDRSDLRELQELLSQPHFKVSSADIMIKKYLSENQVASTWSKWLILTVFVLQYAGIIGVTLQLSFHERIFEKSINWMEKKNNIYITMVIQL